MAVSHLGDKVKCAGRGRSTGDCPGAGVKGKANRQGAGDNTPAVCSCASGSRDTLVVSGAYRAGRQTAGGDGQGRFNYDGERLGGNGRGRALTVRHLGGKVKCAGRGRSAGDCPGARVNGKAARQGAGDNTPVVRKNSAGGRDTLVVSGAYRAGRQGESGNG